MKKTQIFEEIVNVMRFDSSTCKDRTGDDEKCRRIIRDGMADEEFIFAVKCYLAGFGVPWHVHFHKKGKQCEIGFRVRRLGDSLYVTRAYANSGFALGDEITAIDGLTVPRAAEKYACLLYGESPERQGIYWREILSYCNSVTVIERGSATERKINKNVAKTPRPPFEFRRIDNGTVYIRLDNFFSTEQTERFIGEHDAEIRGSGKLIIDVRENCGGTDTAFFNLISYCLGKGVKLRDAIKYTYANEINFTERNVDLRVALLEDYRKDATPSTYAVIDDMIAMQIENRGKGFVVCDGEAFDVTGVSDTPERVFVLTDYICGSSGESFVQNVSGLDKVTVAGRNTMGILDYSNLAEIDFGDYLFCYPTSRSLSVDFGEGTTCKGIKTDLYIPWTAEHLYNDIDLETVLKL